MHQRWEPRRDAKRIETERHAFRASAQLTTGTGHQEPVPVTFPRSWSRGSISRVRFQPVAHASGGLDADLAELLPQISDVHVDVATQRVRLHFAKPEVPWHLGLRRCRFLVLSRGPIASPVTVPKAISESQSFKGWSSGDA